MSDWIELIVPLLGGILLGMFYFLGLWWTIGRLSRADRPASLYLLSFGVRITILLLAFFFLLHVGVLELLVAFAGFIATRFALVRCLGLATCPNLNSDSPSPSAGPTKTGAS